MATTTTTFLLLFALLLSTTTSTSASASSSATSATASFIRSSCKSTRYPSLCERSLSSLPLPPRPTARSLALAALSVSLGRAKSASSFVSRLPSPARGPLRDCVETLSDGVDRIRRSLAEMGRMGRAGSPGFALHLANVQTWVSAALTDENTCLDGFSDSAADAALRASVRREVVAVAQVTSNALALVNKVAP